MRSWTTLGLKFRHVAANSQRPLPFSNKPMAIVRLKPTADADLDVVVNAESDPDTCPFIIAWPRDRHAIALDDPDIAHRVAEDEAENPVGFVILGGLTNPDASIEFRRIVVVPKKGQGYGRSIVRTVIELAFKSYRPTGFGLTSRHTTPAHARFTRARGSLKRDCYPRVHSWAGRLRVLGRHGAIAS